jgi:hypothetical protein
MYEDTKTFLTTKVTKDAKKRLSRSKKMLCVRFLVLFVFFVVQNVLVVFVA